MVIVTLSVVDAHELIEIVHRPQRDDCYAHCSCGYRGPSCEVRPEAGIDRSDEARTHYETHYAIELSKVMNEQAGGAGVGIDSEGVPASMIRWRVERRDREDQDPRVIYSVDPHKLWERYASAYDKRMAEDAARMRQSFRPIQMTDEPGGAFRRWTSAISARITRA